MITAIIIIAAVLVVLGVLVGSLVLSARKGGRLSQKVAGAAMRSEKARTMATRQVEAMLESNPEALTDLLESQPEIVEQVAAQQGVDPAVAQMAMARFSKLPPAQRKQAVEAFSTASEQGIEDPAELAKMMGAPAPRVRTAADNRAAAKKKAKARAARKNAKRTRGR